MLQLDLLTPRKTVLHQLGAIYKDEGTIEGTYRVYTDIQIYKLGLKEDNQSHCFNRRLQLAQGDQKTTQNIRSIKAKQCLTSRAFNHRDQLLGLSAFFYVLQSFLYLIIRTYQESPIGTYSKYILLYNIGYQDRYRITRKNAKYYLIKPLIMQGQTAYILAIQYKVLRSYQCFRVVNLVDKDKYKTYKDVVSQLSPNQFLCFIEYI